MLPIPTLTDRTAKKFNDLADLNYEKAKNRIFTPEEIEERNASIAEFYKIMAKSKLFNLSL